jgi:4-alpha-glucanotransferase
VTEPLPPDLLDRLCEELGVDREYWDLWGQQHHASAAAQAAILTSLGLDASNANRLRLSAEELSASRWTRELPPVLVVSMAESMPAVRLCVPDSLVPGGSVTVTLRLENGRLYSRTYPLSSLASIETCLIGQENYLALSLPLPGVPELGYHEVQAVVEGASGLPRTSHCRLVVAPDRAWLPEALNNDGKLAGLAVSLFGIRSARNWGIGDFTDLRRLTRWAASALGVSFIGLNPLHALHNREPYNTSPYLPLSAFARNTIYLDVEAVEDFALCPAAQRITQGEGFQTELTALRTSDQVCYEEVARMKLGILRLLFRRFLREEWRQGTGRARSFDNWRHQQGELLERFAVYCALDEVLHAQDRELWIWPDWPEAYRSPDTPTVRKFAESHWRRVLFHEWLQWQVDLQLEAAQKEAGEAGMAIGLYHDLALATDKCGADLWSYGHFYAAGCRVGSPPDGFAPDGQDWAFPPPRSTAHREDGYRLFIESIRRNSRHGGALRIDHFMRFFRLFWIPDGFPAKEGTYVQECWQDLLRILALESVRGRFLVVGEDLGTVPPELREAMERFGILSYRLFYFEKGWDGEPKRPRDYARQALVSSTTHDLPTLAGFWAAKDIETRRAAGLLPDPALHRRQLEERHADKAKLLSALIREGFLSPEFPREAADWNELTGELHNAIIGYLASTPSMLLLLNQEDLTKELEQQNLPGTTWQYPNWKRKMRFSLEELEGSPRAADFARMFRGWMVRTGRLNPVPADQRQPA